MSHIVDHVDFIIKYMASSPNCEAPCSLLHSPSKVQIFYRDPVLRHPQFMVVLLMWEMELYAHTEQEANYSFIIFI
jgi:hypothetical protein